MNVTLNDSSESENSSSSSAYESSFMEFTIIIEEFPEVMLAESENEPNDNDSEVAIVDANHELSIQDAYIDLC